jgi:hypothetical protein
LNVPALANVRLKLPWSCFGDCTPLPSSNEIWCVMHAPLPYPYPLLVSAQADHCHVTVVPAFTVIAAGLKLESTSATVFGFVLGFVPVPGFWPPFVVLSVAPPPQAAAITMAVDTSEIPKIRMLVISRRLAVSRSGEPEREERATKSSRRLLIQAPRDLSRTPPKGSG